MGAQTSAVTELLERERELHAIGSVVRRARGGSGGVLLIEGPAGVGKSRLLASARATAREAGMQVLEARGAVLEREFAFGVARQLFEHAVTQLTGSEREPLFSGAAGLAAGLFGQGEVGPGDSGEQAFGVLHALYWLAVNLADRGAVLVSVDDAHLSDPSSLRFLAYLARRLDGLPIALIATGRSGDPEGDELWRALGEDPLAEVIRPQPLSETAAAQVVRTRLGDESEADFCAACHRATGGNPLFLRELIAALGEAGVEPTRDAAETVTSVGPRAVSRFVLHRLERLGPAPAALARALAVLGGEAEFGLVARAAALDETEARAAADLLVRAELLAADQRLRFVHPIVQAAIYDDLLPGERAAHHLAAAELLHREGAPAERVAAHIVQGEPSGDQRWIEVLRLAARNAIERAEPGAAATYLRRALEEGPADQVRLELLCELGRWEVGLQEYDGAREHLRAVLDASAPLELRARAAVWLGRAEIAASKPASAAAALDAIAATMEEADGDLALELEAAALILVRVALPLRELVPERQARFERHAAGNARFEPIARVHAAAERLLRGEEAAAVADEVEAILNAGPPADPWPLGIAIEALIFADRYQVAGRWLELALGAARALGIGTQLAGAHAQRALLALARGPVGDVQLDAEVALELAGPRHFALTRIVGLGMRSAIEHGDVERARELADTHEELFDGVRLFQDELLTARGALRLAQGRPRDALDDLLLAGDLLEQFRTGRPAGWRAEAVRALLELDERERAERLAREGLEAARAFGAPRGLTRALRSAGRAIGGDEGLELLEEAASLGDHSPARLEAAHALADLGGELVARRRRREGREVLRNALEEALRCGAVALAERVRGDLGAGGGRPARLELSGVDALTPAERRVCELAAKELSNREIAQTLFVTEKTVELHLTNAYRKLGIRSRFQLAAAMPDTA